MSKKKLRTVHFCFNAAGKDRSIFTVRENQRNGEITIPLRSDRRSRLPGLGGVAGLMIGLEVREQHYSVHPSKNSPRGINSIHHTVVYEDGSKDGKKVDTTHVTHAVKRNDGKFALLFVRRCSDLRSDRFEPPPPNVEQVNLGTIDCDHFTPIYSVLATHPDNRLDLSGLDDSNAIELLTGKVKLIVVWTFVSLPSHHTSLTGHVRTVKPADPTEPLDEGATTEQFIQDFQVEREKLDAELRQFHLSNLDVVHGSPLLIPTRRFFKDGSAPTAESRQYMDHLAFRIIEVPGFPTD
ncbi:hypothetical protein [Bradyrhizobium roseum]|uniref:hypothetical protein n=1 Tax=Bradyrhizobium roseum TaxID=3056648 RepID=UPI002602746F|nr:hypothetical protein [Bradyrhizobium roseus]WKA31601.1 hypothetical protein QUH67_16205 [Bradyrhizobium roseus]